MTGPSLLEDLGVLVVSGTLAALALRPLGVPSVVAYIGAGLLLGPATDLFHVTPDVHLVSELGIALLLFLVGLEMSLTRIRAVGRLDLTTGLGQVLVVGLLGTAAGLALGLGWPASVVTGLAVSFSSTAVVVKLFRVFLLLPVVLAVGWWFTRRGRRHGEARVPVPGFALAFLALCILNSAAAAAPWAQPVYTPVKALLVELSSWGLLIAIGALGLGTSLQAVRELGWRHLVLVVVATGVILAAMAVVLVAAG